VATILSRFVAPTTSNFLRKEVKSQLLLLASVDRVFVFFRSLLPEAVLGFVSNGAGLTVFLYGDFLISPSFYSPVCFSRRFKTQFRLFFFWRLRQLKLALLFCVILAALFFLLRACRKRHSTAFFGRSVFRLGIKPLRLFHLRMFMGQISRMIPV